MTFLLSDLITEVYGYKHARKALWYGFLFNLLFIIYGQIVIHLPSPTFQTNNQAFDLILTTNVRIILASIVSYICSEPLNSVIMAKLKIKLNGCHLGFRFVLSCLFASGIDSIIFGGLAFYKIIANQDLINLILSMWLIKVSIEVIGLPLSIKLTNRLKKYEHLDIYDRDTKFNIFNLDATYKHNANEFGKNYPINAEIFSSAHDTSRTS